MNWQDDITLQGDASTILHTSAGPTRRGTLQLAMYALHLASGNSLLCRTLKTSTIENYVRDAANFLGLFHRPAIDFRMENNNQKQTSALLKAVYAECRRWETVPDRREAYTLDMQTVFERQVKKSNAPTTSKRSTLCRHYRLGLFTGQRLTEWAQPSHNSNPKYPFQDKFGNTKGFCLNDHRGQTYCGRHVMGAEFLKYKRHQIKKVWIEWRTQKNNRNGEK
jgi:hypothetical protein